MTDYEKLLEKAYKNVKQVSSNGERFEIPKVDGRFEGKKTIITNFAQIASQIRRNPEQFQKFLLKELAASGKVDGDRLILNIRVPRTKIDAKIEQYIKEFVLCTECGKPDTEIIKQDRMQFLHCLACGAKHPIRSKI